MRKVLLVAGLLMGGALIGGGPASAATGCLCATVTHAPVCVGTVGQCVVSMHGICVAPCDYHPPRRMKKAHKAKKKM